MSKEKDCMKDEIFDVEKDINIDRLARLARFTLSDDERASLAEELKKMADYTYPRVLSEEKALPFIYVFANKEAREDVAIPTSADQRELILASCPSIAEGYVRVPQVIKEEE